MNNDLISRDAVLDACSQSINILDAMSRIEDLPSVTPKQEPCDVYDEYGNYKYPSDVELTEPNTATSMPYEDAISRQAVLYGLASIAKAKAKSDAQKSLMGRVMFFAEQLPSVTPKQRWIPVSERLPEDHDWYVIVVKEKSTGYQYIPRIASHNHDNCWSIIDTEDADKDWLDDLECVAWMPLPEPYEPQESEGAE